ncbi:MAG: hypothetical protein K6F15_02755 [Treponema sp.]|nr:hypothetical protein [Treponema sp.]
MEDIKRDKKTSIGTKIGFIIAFFLIGLLILENMNLKERIDYYVEKNDEFQSNLYASTEGSYRQGAHTLSISDVYYEKYFKNTNEKKE